MSIIRRDSRGQISAEYLLLLVVILVIFGFMISNFIGPTIDASNNVSAVSDTKGVVDSIASAVNIVYANGPESRKTVTVDIPKNMTLTFTGNLVSTTVSNLNYKSNGNTTTSKVISAPINYGGAISSLTLSSNGSWCTVQVYWNSSTNNITVTQIS